MFCNYLHFTKLLKSKLFYYYLYYFIILAHKTKTCRYEIQFKQSFATEIS